MASSAWLSLKKIALLTAAAIVAINIWTGAPLLALWIGSQVQGDTGISMTAILTVLGVLITLVVVLTIALSWLNARYDVAIGRPPPKRQPYPWLRSLRAERESDVQRQRGVSGVEKAVIASVVVAVIAFEIWLFFFAEYVFQ